MYRLQQGLPHGLRTDGRLDGLEHALEAVALRVWRVAAGGRPEQPATQALGGAGEAEWTGAFTLDLARFNLQPGDAVSLRRQVSGLYADLSADLTPALFADLALRWDRYGDFGSATTAKLAAGSFDTTKIGSGAIESTCKTLIQAREKQPAADTVEIEQHFPGEALKPRCASLLHPEHVDNGSVTLKCDTLAIGGEAFNAFIVHQGAQFA